MDTCIIAKIKKEYNGKDLIDLIVRGKIPYLAKEMIELEELCECKKSKPKYMLVLLEHTGFLKYKVHVRFYCDECRPRYI